MRELGRFGQARERTGIEDHVGVDVRALLKAEAWAKGRAGRGQSMSKRVDQGAHPAARIEEAPMTTSHGPERAKRRRRRESALRDGLAQELRIDPPDLLGVGPVEALVGDLPCARAHE